MGMGFGFGLDKTIPKSVVRLENVAGCIWCGMGFVCTYLGSGYIQKVARRNEGLCAGKWKTGQVFGVEKGLPEVRVLIAELIGLRVLLVVDCWGCRTRYEISLWSV